MGFLNHSIVLFSYPTGIYAIFYRKTTQPLHGAGFYVSALACDVMFVSQMLWLTHATLS